MGKKKASRPELRIGYKGDVERVNCPDDEKELLKEVPAKIKWADIPNIDREDEEVVGRTLIYTDHSFDVIYDFEAMSDDAKKLLGYYQQTGPYSIGEQGVN